MVKEHQLIVMKLLKREKKKAIHRIRRIKHLFQWIVKINY